MSEKRCDLPAMFRYTWPGKEESFSCLMHAIGIRRIADAMGLSLQFIQLDIDDVEAGKHTCQNFVKDDAE